MNHQTWVCEWSYIKYQVQHPAILFFIHPSLTKRRAPVRRETLIRPCGVYQVYTRDFVKCCTAWRQRGKGEMIHITQQQHDQYFKDLYSLCGTTLEKYNQSINHVFSLGLQVISDGYFNLQSDFLVALFQSFSYLDS